MLCPSDTVEIVQFLLDTDLILDYPELFELADYYVTEGLCYQVPVWQLVIWHWPRFPRVPRIGNLGDPSYRRCRDPERIRIGKSHKELRVDFPWVWLFYSYSNYTADPPRMVIQCASFSTGCTQKTHQAADLVGFVVGSGSPLEGDLIQVWLRDYVVLKIS